MMGLFRKMMNGIIPIFYKNYGSRFYILQKLPIHRIQGTAFGNSYKGILQLPETEGLHAIRISGKEHFPLINVNQIIGSL